MGSDEEVLQGGVANAGAVVRVGEHVLRPAPTNADTLHALTRYVRDLGGDLVPEPLGIDPDGRERLVLTPSPTRASAASRVASRSCGATTGD